MKSIDTWLDEYGESHQNHTNKAIHFICVPLIFFTIVGLLYNIKLIYAFGIYITVSHVLLLALLVYYFLLSIPIAMGMLLFSGLCLVICQLIVKNNGNLLLITAVLFVLAWIAQFLGHKVEGKKPSFLKDIQFLLIGPAWIMNFLLKKLK